MTDTIHEQRFDVGFHFTGGFNDDRNGVLDEILTILGVRDRIHPIYFPRDACHRMIFPAAGIEYVIPCGAEIVREQLKRDFPAERDGIDRRQVTIHLTPKGERLLSELSLHHRDELRTAGRELARVLRSIIAGSDGSERRGARTARKRT